MRLSQLVDKLVKLVDKFAGVALPVLLAGVALPVPVELSMVDVAGVALPVPVPVRSTVELYQYRYGRRCWRTSRP